MYFTLPTHGTVVFWELVLDSLLIAISASDEILQPESPQKKMSLRFFFLTWQYILEHMKPMHFFHKHVHTTQTL